MSRIIEHVRFKLSDLIGAVQSLEKKTTRPSVQEALGFYWNWALGRGWALVAVTSQLDPSSAVLNIENSPQLELRNEEFWNVIWSGEDTRGSANLLEFEQKSDISSADLFSSVVYQLLAEGWFEEVPQPCLRDLRKAADSGSFATVAALVAHVKTGWPLYAE